MAEKRLIDNGELVYGSFCMDALEWFYWIKPMEDK